MKTTVFAALCSVFLITGCSTIHQSQPSTPLLGPISSNLYADIFAGPKIEGHASKACVLWIFCNSPDKYADGILYHYGNPEYGYFSIDSANDVKSAAAYDAVTKYNADLIIMPKYIIEYNNYFIYQSWNATVTGYLGTIRGFAKIIK
jgi:hypothetical protein